MYAAQTRHEPLISFDDRQHRVLRRCLIAILAVALLFRLHGWSISIWHSIIDGSPRSEIIWGHARDIRSDDYLLDIPMIMAQTAHEPKFPVVNSNIGSGQFMLAPIKAPAKDFIILYRPFTWGFIVGNDFGLSWMWWTLSLGLFYSFFLVFMLVSRNHFGISFWISFSILYSPYFQFWSLHKAEIAIHWALTFIGGAYLVSSDRRRNIWWAALLMGWSLAGMALDHIYPPIAVSVGWLLPFAAAAWCWDRRMTLGWKNHLADRIGGAIMALAIAAISVEIFFYCNRGFIHLIQNTIYPGQRFSTGGSFPLWAFMSQNFFAEHWERHGSWAGNICESSSFIFIFPAIWIISILYSVTSRKWPDGWSPILAIYIGIVMIYTYAGFPDWLARWTFFGQSTDNRTQMGLGLANALISVAFLSNGEVISSLKKNPAWIGLFLWTALVMASGLWFRSHWADLKINYIIYGTIFNAIIFYFLFVKKYPTLGICILAIISCIYTFDFNPLVKGGSKFLFKNPLSREIIKLSRDDGNRHTWVVFGNDWISNLFRIIGVKSFGGYQGHPHFAIWKQLDPNGTYSTAYNRCGWVAFQPADSLKAEITNPNPTLVQVEINPLSPVLKMAGVRYFLAAGKPAIQTFEKCGAFNELFIYADKAIFEIK